jgi:hypothetical protein
MEGIMAQPRFLHDDVVKLAGQEQVGTVKGVEEIDDHYVYKVQAKGTSAGIVTVSESDLELVRIANNEETGFALRYIT